MRILRTGSTLEYLRVVRLLKPTWVVFENVKGMVETEKGLFFQRTVGDLTHQGYRVSSWVLNAADFGVPQIRFRLFIVGSLEGASVPKPQASRLPHVTVREAIADLPFCAMEPPSPRYRIDFRSLLNTHAKCVDPALFALIMSLPRTTQTS